MRGGIRLKPRRGWAGVSAVLILLASGCEPTSPLKEAGVAISPGADWRPVAPNTWPVPGRPVAAWSGPGGASMVVYRSLPIPDGEASQIIDGLVNRLVNLPGMTVVVRGVESWSGQSAGRVEVVAPGMGDALAASGTGVAIAPKDRTLVPTRQVVLGFARPADTLYVTWTAPESANHDLQERIRATLGSLRLDPIRVRRSSY